MELKIHYSQLKSKPHIVCVKLCKLVIGYPARRALDNLLACNLQSSLPCNSFRSALSRRLFADCFGFLPLCLQPNVLLSAEILFLHKQLAFYQERKGKPRRLNNDTSG